MNPFIVIDKSGNTRLVIPARAAAIVLGSGFGTWKNLKSGRRVYVMQASQVLAVSDGPNQVELYLHPDDRIAELTE